MEISFATKEIRNLCENEDAAFECYGSIIANALKTRLAELMASPSMEDFPFALTIIVDKSNHTCSLPISQQATLVFSIHDSINLDIDVIENVTWFRVLRIQIREIINNANDSAK